MFDEGNLDREIDDAVETVVKNKEITFQMESGLFKDSLLQRYWCYFRKIHREVFKDVLTGWKS